MCIFMCNFFFVFDSNFKAKYRAYVQMTQLIIKLSWEFGVIRSLSLVYRHKFNEILDIIVSLTMYICSHDVLHPWHLIYHTLWWDSLCEGPHKSHSTFPKDTKLEASWLYTVLSLWLMLQFKHVHPLWGFWPFRYRTVYYKFPKFIESNSFFKKFMASFKIFRFVTVSGFCSQMPK